jgi:VanZ family protein
MPLQPRKLSKIFMIRAVNDPPRELARTPALLLMRLARIAGWAGIATITILSLVPGSLRPHTGFPGQAEHFAAYACTGFALSLAYLGLRTRLIFWSCLATASSVFEILQIWIPGRDAKIQDALASTLGLTTGLLIGATLAAQILAELSVKNPEQKCQHQADH